MARKEVHFADKVDREIGTARCGARLRDGVRHVQDRAQVTCLRCGSEKALVQREDVTHLNIGNSSNACRCKGPSSETLVLVTCPSCLRERIRIETERADRNAAAMASASVRADQAESSGSDLEDGLDMWRKRCLAAEEVAEDRLGAVISLIRVCDMLTAKEVVSHG